MITHISITQNATTRKIVAVVAALVLVGIGIIAGALITRSSPPSEDSAAVGFARDMSEHHAQAVEMGMIAHQNATVPEIRTLGGDIAMTQQAQIGMMQAWLSDWGYGPTGSKPAMAWMPDGESALNGNLMPGMATSDEMDKLRKATGKDVDILFCQYMLRHHLGGIHMADGLLQAGAPAKETALAETMKQGQSGEVALLRKLLGELGSQPLS